MIDIPSASSGYVAAQVRFGAAPIGNLFHEVTDAQVQSTLATSLAVGFTAIDTAPYYGNGLSESRIGEFLRASGADLTISTKVGRRLIPCPPDAMPATGFVGTPHFAPTFDLTRDGIFIAFEDSLARLGVDRVETLLLHDVGRMTHGDAHIDMLPGILDEALPAMRELRDSGRVGRIGLGVNEVAVVDELLPSGLIDVVLLAGRYTLLDRSASVLLDRCAARGTAVLAAGVFNSGLLAGGTKFNYAPASPSVIAGRDSLAAICARYDVSLAAAALQFPLRHAAVEQVVVGMRTVAEVEDAARFVVTPIPAALWEELDRASSPPC